MDSETTDSLDKLVFEDSRDFDLDKPASGSSRKHIDLIEDSTGGVASFDYVASKGLTQDQVEAQQEMALRSEIEEKLLEIEKDSSMDMGKIGEKITSLENLRQQLEQKLSNQTNTEQTGHVGSFGELQTPNAQDQEVNKESDDVYVDSGSKTQPVPQVAAAPEAQVAGYSQAVADSKKDAFIKEALKNIEKKIEEEKKKKAHYEEQERQIQQELDM